MLKNVTVVPDTKLSKILFFDAVNVLDESEDD